MISITTYIRLHRQFSLQHQQRHELWQQRKMHSFLYRGIQFIFVLTIPIHEIYVSFDERTNVPLWLCTVQLYRCANAKSSQSKWNREKCISQCEPEVLAPNTKIKFKFRTLNKLWNCPRVDMQIPSMQNFKCALFHPTGILGIYAWHAI